MRLPVFLLLFANVFATSARSDDDCRCWTPGEADIAAVEANIAGHQLPLDSLDRYARYYAGTTDNGRRFIWGKLAPIDGNDTPGIHVVEGRMPPLQGEGCITYSESGGSGLSVKCTRPGDWTPSGTQIAELEGLLQLPPDKYFPLQDYARYYAGETQGGRRIVIGVFFWSRTAGIHVVADIYLSTTQVFDAGCGQVFVRYDPSSKEISSRCSNEFAGTKF